MKALQIIETGKTAVVSIPAPAAGPGQVLLKLEYVGFCGSDLNTFRGFNPLVTLPRIPGHEIGARIESIGEGVPGYLKPGMAVTVNPYSNCGHCPACRNFRPNACENNETLGVQRDGAMAEYIVLPWEKVLPCEGLDTRELALVEPMSVGFHAADRAAVKDIDTVMVFGCGMVGLGAMVRSVIRGARVIAVDVDDSKLALAKEMGAAYTVNSMTQNLHEEIQRITDGRGVDVTIEAVGRPETYRAAIAETAFTGRVTYIGYAKAEVSFDTSYFVKKELDIRGSRNALPSDFEAVMAYMKRGICPVEKLISREVSFEEAHEALESWAAKPGEVFRILLKI